MADFCKQCSIETFGEDFEELAGLIHDYECDHGLSAGVICEGCGYTYVNHAGICVNPDCLENHGRVVKLKARTHTMFMCKMRNDACDHNFDDSSETCHICGISIWAVAFMEMP